MLGKVTVRAATCQIFFLPIKNYSLSIALLNRLKNDAQNGLPTGKD
jgi:hypothetical protein